MAQELTIEQRMERFKKRKGSHPDIAKFDSEYEVEKHKIFTDLTAFPDKKVEVVTKLPNGEELVSEKIIPLNRIGLPYQELINNMAATFLFANEVTYTNNDEKEELFDSFKKVISKNKMVFFDKEVAIAVGRYTECAELWYTVEGSNADYGFNSEFKLKTKLLTPNEYKLYPVFDNNDDMISFGREFTLKDGDKSTQILEVYTATEIITYRDEGNGWSETIITNPIGKIPVVYYSQQKVEWHKAQSSIERMEKLFSNNGESNDKFAYPILSLIGKAEGSFTDDKSGKVLQMSEGGSADFVTPPNANESLENEMDRLDDNIYTFTQTPNVFSMSKLQGMGNMLASENAEFIFLSAHLKAKDKFKIYIPGLMRRASIIESYLQQLNVKFRSQSLDIKPVITPFVVNNAAAFLRMLMEANGNQPIYSQRYAMEMAGVEDVDKMQQQLNEEQEKKASTQIL